MHRTKNKGSFEQIYKVVKKIPQGKVMTYGQVAEMAGGRDARIVGWAMHGNKSKEVPCHRVVNKDGFVAKNFAFDGWREQKKRLLSEGVSFIGEKQVNLEKHSVYTRVNNEV